MAPLDPLSLPSDAPGGAPAARLLFVCWGNICRSPTAEAVMRATLEREGLAHLVHVDSAGTSAEHAGDPPDPRSIAEAARRGLDLRPLRARQIEPSDFERFDMLLVADALVERTLLRSAPAGAPVHKVHRMTAFGPDAGIVDEVPDPYYGGPDGFVEVLDLLERACTGLVEHLRPRVAGRA